MVADERERCSKPAGRCSRPDATATRTCAVAASGTAAGGTACPGREPPARCRRGISGDPGGGPADVPARPAHEYETTHAACTAVVVRG
ncbi:hypothetical protein AB0M50_55655, partial [Nonomuraea fuscirosea]|uniref:hypothetical protein n=1 Tax=Nonomuraea fuscirosea TaxID=1291556 RepID=UPI003440BECE